MASNRLDIALILSASDRASRVITQMTNNAIKSLDRVSKTANKISSSAFSIGRDTGAMGAGTAVALSGPVMAFANVEEAALSLKSVMMKDGGVLNTKQFNEVSKLATSLGNKLPGTTQDFYEMFDTMIRNGIPAENILAGVGKSASYLAVALKLPYAEAGKMAAKLQEATGVADKDMMGFMDTIARTANVGVEAGEMQYAFARSAGALKLMKIQGLEASKSISTVYAMLVKAGASGETVGTGMSSVLNAFMNKDKVKALNDATKALGVSMSFTDRSGNFLGVENMIAQFDKLKNFSSADRASVVQAFLGPGADAGFMNILIDKGVSGYNQMVDRMKAQADLNTKVEAQLAGQKAMWEAATGTFTNVQAMVGGLVSEDITNFLKYLNEDLLPSLSKWIDENQGLVKTLVYGVGAFAAVNLGVSALSFGVGAVSKTFSLFTGGLSAGLKIFQAIRFGLFALRFGFMFTLWPAIVSATTAVWGFTVALLANPITWIAVGVIAAAAAVTLLVVKWKEITKWFKNSHPVVKALLIPLIAMNLPIIAIAFAIRKLIDNWGIIKKFFTNVTNLVTGIPAKFFAAGKNIVTSLYNGIKSVAKMPVDAISNITKSMRDYLPFSPAKKGAFMDLHKVKIVETIAGAMRPAPLVSAMATATSSAMGGKGKSGGSVASSGGSIVINYNPTINVSGSGGDIKSALKENADYLLKLIDQKLANKKRTAF